MVTYKFSFFFNLVEKNSFTVKKISKCRENGIDRLRNGNLLRRGPVVKKMPPFSNARALIMRKIMRSRNAQCNTEE